MLPNCYYAHLSNKVFHILVSTFFKIIFTLSKNLKLTFMKWLSVNTGSLNENFELWDDERKLAEISFTKGTRIARFVSSISRRIFFFEKKGLLYPKAIIKNEYGIKMGKLKLGKQQAQNGFLELDGKKYQYIFNENNSGELNVYDEIKNSTILTCTFPLPTQTQSTLKSTSFLDSKLPSLLLVLCWYAFQPNTLAIK